MSRTKRKKAAYKKNNQNRYSKFLVVIALFMLVGVAWYGGHKTQEKLDAKLEEMKQNEVLIEKEHEREKEIELLGKKVQTKEYYEEQAKEKLGLVYPGEIVFKAEN